MGLRLWRRKPARPQCDHVWIKTKMWRYPVCTKCAAMDGLRGWHPPPPIDLDRR